MSILELPPNASITLHLTEYKMIWTANQTSINDLYKNGKFEPYGIENLTVSQENDIPVPATPSQYYYGGNTYTTIHYTMTINIKNILKAKLTGFIWDITDTYIKFEDVDHTISITNYEINE